MQYFHANKNYKNKFTVAVFPPNLLEVLLSLIYGNKPVKILFGISKLHPTDQYNKKTGRNIANSKLAEFDSKIEKFTYCNSTQKYTISLLVKKNSSSYQFLFHLKENYPVMKLINFTMIDD